MGVKGKKMDPFFEQTNNKKQGSLKQNTKRGFFFLAVGVSMGRGERI